MNNNQTRQPGTGYPTSTDERLTPMHKLLTAALAVTALIALAGPASAICVYLPSGLFCTPVIISQGNPPASPPNSGRGDQRPR